MSYTLKEMKEKAVDANPLTAIGLILLFLAALWVIWQPLG